MNESEVKTEGKRRIRGGRRKHYLPEQKPTKTGREKGRKESEKRRRGRKEEKLRIIPRSHPSQKS